MEELNTQLEIFHRLARKYRTQPEALKEQFGQLVALAAAQVTGKMLTEEDQRRINREAIDSLDS